MAQSNSGTPAWSMFEINRTDDAPRVPSVGWCGCQACNGTGSAASTANGSGPNPFVKSGVGWSDNGGIASGGISIVPGSGGVVTWSIASAGLADKTDVTFFNGTTVDMGSFLKYDYEAVLRQAFAAWSHAADIQFVQVADQGGDIGIGNASTIRIAGGDIDGANNVLAQAFFPDVHARAGDMVFDTGDRDLYASQHNFFIVAAHEIGHALGLNHEETNLALMNPYFNEALQGLQFDDINGIRAIYGQQDFKANAYWMPATLTNLTLIDDAGGARVHGNAGGNVITGTTQDNHLFGHGGKDTLVGGGGNDHLYGGGHADRIDGGAGHDLARYDDASYGNLTVSLLQPLHNTGAAAGDTFTGIEGLALGNGNDRIFGDALANELLGGGGNDEIWGGLGADRIDGGAGYDTVRFDETMHRGVTADLANTIAGTGAAAGDRYTGVEGLVLTQYGDRGYGDAGANQLNGRGGNDLLDGRGGNDTLTGGTGNDTFVMRAGHGRDTVTDFAGGAGVGDQLDLKGQFASFAAVRNAATQVGANTEIRLASGDVVVLQNFDKHMLAADDVIL